MRNAELLSARIIGRERNMLKFQIRDDSHVTMEALYFGDASAFMETVTARYGRDCAERLLAGKSSGIRMSFTFIRALMNTWVTEMCKLSLPIICNYNYL